MLNRVPTESHRWELNPRPLAAQFRTAAGNSLCDRSVAAEFPGVNQPASGEKPPRNRTRTAFRLRALWRALVAPWPPFSSPADRLTGRQWVDVLRACRGAV